MLARPEANAFQVLSKRPATVLWNRTISKCDQEDRKNDIEEQHKLHLCSPHMTSCIVASLDQFSRGCQDPADIHVHVLSKREDYCLDQDDDCSLLSMFGVLSSLKRNVLESWEKEKPWKEEKCARGNDISSFPFKLNL